MFVIVVDYGSGNLRSAAKALEKANEDNNLKYNIQISSDPNLIKNQIKSYSLDKDPLKIAKKDFQKLQD